MRSKAGSYASLVYRTVRYTLNRLQINKWVIKEDPLCLIDLLNAIHEQQCCGGVADEEREKQLMLLHTIQQRRWFE